MSKQLHFRLPECWLRSPWSTLVSTSPSSHLRQVMQRYSGILVIFVTSSLDLTSWPGFWQHASSISTCCPLGESAEATAPACRNPGNGVSRAWGKNLPRPQYLFLFHFKLIRNTLSWFNRTSRRLFKVSPVIVWSRDMKLNYFLSKNEDFWRQLIEQDRIRRNIWLFSQRTQKVNWEIELQDKHLSLFLFSILKYR